jgi:beta-glucosidase
VIRLSLKPGESRRVSFTITPEQLSVIDDQGRRVVRPGEFLVTVGGKQPGFKGHADAATTGVVSGRFVVTGRTTELRQR